MKMVPLLNPIRKPIKRVGVSKTRYVSRPSQATGTKPTPRLKARRAVAKRKGAFPNPTDSDFKCVDTLKDVRRIASHASMGSKHHAFPLIVDTVDTTFDRIKAARSSNPKSVDKIGQFAGAYYTLIDAKGTIFFHSLHATQDNAARKAEELQEKNPGLLVYVWPKGQYDAALSATIRKLLK